MVMTPEAKGQLSKTIRALRARLLEDFQSANDSTFKYSIRRIDQAKLSEANATRRRRMLEGKGGSDGYLDGWEEAIKDS